MDLDKLKHDWQQLELRIDKIENENKRLAERLKKNSATGVKCRLTARYGRMTIICILSPIWMVLFDYTINVDTSLYISYVVFFAIMSVTTGYVWWKLRNIDYMSMSVKDALIAVYKTEILCKTHNRIGYITGFPLIIFLMIYIYQLDQQPLIIGAWIGLIIGGSLGTYIKIRNRQLLKKMKQTLAEEISED